MTKITASSYQMANFLFSSYENLISQNEELNRTKQKMRTINGSLEKAIREKTLSLELEVRRTKEGERSPQEHAQWDRSGPGAGR